MLKVWMEMVGVCFWKNHCAEQYQQLHLFLSKRLLEELTGKKRVRDTCARESDAPNGAHEYSRA